jgi:hypothetical protein
MVRCIQTESQVIRVAIPSDAGPGGHYDLKLKYENFKKAHCGTKINKYIFEA